MSAPLVLMKQEKEFFLYPAKVKGYFKNLRTGFYFFLLFVFLILPWTTFHGEQTVFLDIIHHRFIFFGTMFSAHDGPLIFFPLILAGLGLTFVTSIWGRVWCGWACPQTVFLESIFRRIDQWVEGSHTKRMKLDQEPWTAKKISKKLFKWFLFTIVCSHIAHSFTAYFVGAKNLFWLTTLSPNESFGLFLFVQILTLVLLFNFGWFREQFCIIMCPYGRFQSVLMGQKSLAVLYNEKRGEPRKQIGDTEHGDCINCYKCVSVCPMGIDIRRGLQMECIACTACIDVCDEVMEKVGKPKSLISYTSLDSLEGKNKSKFGLRSVVYFSLLLILTSIFVYTLIQRKGVDLKIIRAIEAPYTLVGDSLINHFRVVVTNQGQEKIQIEKPKIANGVVVGPDFPLELSPGEIKRAHLFIKFKIDELEEVKGQKQIIFEVRQGEDSLDMTETITILGP